MLFFIHEQRFLKNVNISRKKIENINSSCTKGSIIYEFVSICPKGNNSCPAKRQ